MRIVKAPSSLQPAAVSSVDGVVVDVRRLCCQASARANVPSVEPSSCKQICKYRKRGRNTMAVRISSYTLRGEGGGGGGGVRFFLAPQTSIVRAAGVASLMTEGHPFHPFPEHVRLPYVTFTSLASLSVSCGLHTARSVCTPAEQNKVCSLNIHAPGSVGTSARRSMQGTHPSILRRCEQQ